MRHLDFDDAFDDRRAEFREQMTRCRGCGALCDGDVCDVRCGRLADELDELGRASSELGFDLCDDLTDESGDEDDLQEDQDYE